MGRLTSGERGKNVTILLCINASGDQFVPPLFVFPRVRMDPELTKDAPEGSVFDAQPSGWICKESFLKWLKMFAQRVNPTEENPVLLIVDGHASHKELDVITFARSHNIHMLSLPPHTTHKLQPLDRAIMKPFKNAYNEACSSWMRKYSNMKITLKDVAGLVGSAFCKICRMELAQSAFSCTGIYPLNRDIFSDMDFHTSYTEEPLVSPQTIATGSNTLNQNSSAPQTAIANSKTPTETSRLPFTPVASTSSEHISEISGPSPISASSPELLQKLSPSPSGMVMNARKKRADRSEVLTSSPYKLQLEEKKRKIGKVVPTLSKKSKKGRKTAKTSLKFDDEEATACIICGETFVEDWIQCSSCKGWAHENCTSLEGSVLLYKCDKCKQM